MNYKKSILVLCCGLAFGMTKAQQSQTFNYTGSTQAWTVPCGVTSITVDVAGAQGGSNGAYTGGLGARMQGTITVTPLEVLTIYVGGEGGTTFNSGSGGGGSGIANAGTPLVVAGAGGGASAVDGYNGLPGLTGTSGGSSSGPGGTNGYGGDKGYTNGDCGYSVGGGGFYGDGYGTCGCQNDGGTLPGTLGAADAGEGAIQGGAGGIDEGCNGNGANGGWGCGGGGSGNYGGGGGGGYSGGGGGQYTPTPSLSPGGGGGSYNSGANQTNTQGYQSGNGYVTLKWNTGASLTVTGNVIDNVLCNGGSTGEASGIISGGGSPYTYLWNNLETTDTATGLSAGTYTIGVSDACGNTASVSVSITQPTALNVSASAISNVLCNGESDGSASSNASGGTSPYTYAWSNLQLTANATGLSAGTYTIGLSDANGCTATASVSITQPTALNISATALTNVLCNGGTDGSASSSASGGTSPYTYLWNNAESNSNATGLSAGTYTLGLTDANGCTASASVNITQPNVLSLSDTVTANVSCNGGSNGIGASVVSGGTSPYTYLWSNLQSSPSATGLTVGTYTLGLTDANGCTATASVGITQPVAIGIVSHSQADNGSGNGAAWVNVSGGTGPYTYLWNPGGNSTDSISKKDSGMYCCLVTDANGCTDSTCIKIKSTLGIGNITSGSGGIMVYPNPNNGQFTIVIASEAKQSQDVVEIYNVLGERVYSQYLIPNSQFLINLSNQPNGIYLYRVISESGSLLGEGKIMLQK